MGFIKEVPATSCREIKASEGVSAVSGNYWLDSIKPGQVTLVSCDMHAGGEFLSGIASLAILNYFKVDENNIIQNAFKAECAAFLKTDNLRNHDSIANKT